MKQLALLLMLLFLPLFGCAPAVTVQPKEKTPAFTVTLTSPAANKKVSLTNPAIQTMLNEYVRRESVKEQYGLGDHFAPNSVALKWTFDGEATSYTVELSRDKNFTAPTVYESLRTTQYVRNLYTSATYYWRVTAHTEKGEYVSSVGRFSTKAGIRTVSISGVSNTRDLGTLSTVDGKQLKQGLVYRAASLDSVTPVGKKTALETLKIKTDLDLRRDGEGTAGMYSPLGNSVQYVHISAPYYYNGTTGLSSASVYEAFADELRIFTKEENYPVLFHCSVGRDRTGTLAFVLELLCGVTEDDVFFDYELSFLSEAGCRDNASVDTMYNQIMPLYNYLKTYASGDIYENTEKFIKEKIGLTDTEIEAIRTIMIEK